MKSNQNKNKQENQLEQVKIQNYYKKRYQIQKNNYKENKKSKNKIMHFIKFN